MGVLLELSPAWLKGAFAGAAGMLGIFALNWLKGRQAAGQRRQIQTDVLANARRAQEESRAAETANLAAVDRALDDEAKNAT